MADSGAAPSLEDIGGNGSMHGNLFLTREILQRVELVRHLLENTAIVPLLTGPRGAGKSTLVDYIDDHAPQHWLVLDIDAETTSSPEALMASLGEQLGLGANVGDMDALTRRLDGIVRQSRVPIVLTDNARNLSSEMLSILLELAEGRVAGRPLLKFVLFADDDLSHLLNLPKFEPIAQTRFQRMELPRFSFGQARAFVAAHYASAGQAIPAGLGFEKLYAVSGGWPGELIQLAGNYMKLTERPEATATADRSRKRPWLLPAAVVVALLAALLWFQQDINRFIAGTEEAVVSPAPPRPPVAHPPVIAPIDEFPPATEPSPAREVDEVAATAVGNRNGADVDSGAVTSSVESPSQTSVEAPRDIVDILLEEGPVDTDSAGDGQVSGAKVGEDLGPVAKESPEPGAAGVAPEAATDVVAKDGRDKAREALSSVGKLQKPLSPPASQHTPVTSVKPPDTPAPTAKPVVQTDAEWLVSAPARDYTLQLMGSYSRPNPKRFARRIGIGANNLHVVRVARNGKPWYVVLHGRYANASAAKKALSRLPPKARRQGAWARRFGSFRPMVD